MATSADTRALLQGIKGIIFDYGGTLDTRGDHWSHIILEGYHHAGLQPEMQDFRAAYVHAERELARVRHIYPEHNFRDLMRIKLRIETDYLVDNGKLSREEADAKSDIIADYCYEYARTCVREAVPTLERLSQRFPLVLVSNFYGNIEAVLADFGLLRFFPTIIESAVVGVRKPDPRIFALGVEATGLPAAEVLVVGDSIRKDILPAQSLGCATAWVMGRGWEATEETAPEGCVAINHVKELDSLIK